MEGKVFELWENGTRMDCYEPKIKLSNGAFVIFPGGGYWGRAEHEGKSYAKFLNENGIYAFVVNYRVHPNRFPLPLLDARRAVKFVRYHAEKFGIDKNKIIAMGSSAGGHLASLLCTYRDEIENEKSDCIDDESFLPNKQVLCYPVINLYDERITHIGSGDALLGDCLKEGGDIEMRKKLSGNTLVTSDTPEAFIWHTFSDELVSVKNTLEYAAALKDAGVNAEIHIYPQGRHGLGLANEEGREEKHVAQWGNALMRWFKDYLGW